MIIKPQKFSIFLRLLIIVIILTLSLSGIQVTLATSEQDLLRKNQELERQQTENQQAAEAKRKEARTLQGNVNQIQGQISDTQSKINQTQGEIEVNQKQIDDLNNQIKQKEAELKAQQDNLSETLRVMYEMGDRSLLEMIVSSNSLSDLVSQNEYLESLENQIESTITNINKIKADLNNNKQEVEKKKAELVTLNESQVGFRSGLENEKRQVKYLLDITKGDQNKYEEMIAKIEKERTYISSQLYEMRRQKGSSGGEIIGGGGSGYSGYLSSRGLTCDQVDDWGFVTCQCTSYAAWKWNSSGRSWYNTRPGSGSAWNWPALARDQGYSVSSSPSAGAIVSWGAGGAIGGWGHVAIVEGVNGDGTINVSEYNWIPLSYSRRSNVHYWDYGVSASFIR